MVATAVNANTTTDSDLYALTSSWSVFLYFSYLRSVFVLVVLRFIISTRADKEAQDKKKYLYYRAGMKKLGRFKGAMKFDDDCGIYPFDPMTFAKKRRCV